MLINDDDDVNFSLVLCTILLFCVFWLCVYGCEHDKLAQYVVAGYSSPLGGVKMYPGYITQTDRPGKLMDMTDDICIHIVTIGDQLDELCSFSDSLPYLYLY